MASPVPASGYCSSRSGRFARGFQPPGLPIQMLLPPDMHTPAGDSFWHAPKSAAAVQIMTWRRYLDISREEPEEHVSILNKHPGRSGVRKETVFPQRREEIRNGRLLPSKTGLSRKGSVSLPWNSPVGRGIGIWISSFWPRGRGVLSCGR